MAGDIKVLKELLAAVIAASTAIIPFPTHTGNLFTPANGYAEETSDNATLPDWVPTVLRLEKECSIIRAHKIYVNL